ncbi:MAG: ATP-binding cassette domain-containing protein, partial [Muribaculaceae bacterium]|nr:ATP-binding cassette domain-containing protein [Muribaculaceae bacterium]
DMTIKRGITTAVVGESGCGKSTVLKLLFGFFDPAEGEVAVGNLPLSRIDEPAWLAGMAVVMQSGTLFSGDILTNIALSDARPSIERAREAARVACIDGFIDGLPMGYGTRIGRTGLELSGGQQQRLLIARAIYRQPEIIVLDEATSALDATTERRVVENIMDAFRGRTVVVVAHRLSTVRRADCIVVMDGGRVAETGTHGELMARRGTYFRLVQNQLENAPAL